MDPRVLWSFGLTRLLRAFTQETGGRLSLAHGFWKQSRGEVIRNSAGMRSPSVAKTGWLRISERPKIRKCWRNWPREPEDVTGVRVKYLVCRTISPTAKPESLSGKPEISGTLLSFFLRRCC